MKRALFVLSALLLVCPLAAGDDAKKEAAAAKAVVVDPMDLRKPVPDPQAGLTEKYDGKLVRFTGLLQSWGKENQQNWYELKVEVPKPSTVVNRKKETKPRGTDVVVVRVYFQAKEQPIASQKVGVALTVAGKGEITTDGSLIIRKAAVVDIGTPIKP
jgi:hypothetical protein